MTARRILVAVALAALVGPGTSHGLQASADTAKLDSDMKQFMKGQEKLAKDLAKTPEYAAAMAYRSSLNAYAKALQTMAKAGKVPAATAREMVSGIRSSMEGVRKNMEAAVKGLPADLKSGGEQMQQLLARQMEILTSPVASLEKGIENAVPDPKAILDDTGQILGNSLGFVEDTLGATRKTIEKAL